MKKPSRTSSKFRQNCACATHIYKDIRDADMGTLNPQVTSA